MIRNFIVRFAGLSPAVKLLVVLATLIVLFMSVVLSPLVVVVAGLVLLVAGFAFFVRLIRRRPLKTWGIIAASALVMVVAFTGISEALYGGGGAETAVTDGQAREPASLENKNTKVKESRPSETTASLEDKQQKDAAEPKDEKKSDSETPPKAKEPEPKPESQPPAEPEPDPRPPPPDPPPRRDSPNAAQSLPSRER